MNDGRGRDKRDPTPDGGTSTQTRTRVEPSGDLSDRTDTDPVPFGEVEREFLLEAIRRTPLLQTLRSGPATSSELLETVDVSRSTLHRATDALAEHDLVENGDGEYELTSLGRIIADETAAFARRAWTGVTLKQFLNAIDGSCEDIPIEHFADADITRRCSRQPHNTIHRIVELIENSERLRMFSTVISPVYVDAGYREMMDGMQIEAIFDREVVDLMLSEWPQKANDTISTGNFSVYAHTGLPFELFLFDEKVGMAAHNDQGNADILVECDDTSAIDWAEELYATHRTESEQILLDEF